MQPAGTPISGNRGARSRLPFSLVRGFLPILLSLFLLIEAFPCATLFGHCCPSSHSEAVHGSRIVAPASCCKASTEASSTLLLPAELQRPVAAPAVLPAELPDALALPFPPALPRLSTGEAKLYDPPPLILLLCTLLN